VAPRSCNWQCSAAGGVDTHRYQVPSSVADCFAPRHESENMAIPAGCRLALLQKLLRKQQQAETPTPASEAADTCNIVLTHCSAPLVVLYAGRRPLAAELQRSRSFASCLTKRIAWIQRRSCWLASTGTREQLAFFCSMAQILC
jgi:hypothetical protein